MEELFGVGGGHEWFKENTMIVILFRINFQNRNIHILKACRTNLQNCGPEGSCIFKLNSG